MVKLNYTKRRSDGTKLGEIIAKDLKKKITPFFAKPEAQRTPVPLELTLPSRKLQDAGLEVFIDDLLSGLASVTSPPCFRLEELNLANNGLTVHALPLIASIIRLSSSDLKTLNLSGNDIHIGSDEATEEWQLFLNAFRKCTSIQTIDLGENDFSDIRALEIFDRVYASHPVIDPISLGNPDDISAAPSPVSKSPNSRKISTSSSSSRDIPSNRESTSDEVTETLMGLRSVPYIILANCGITDAGALCLSYVISSHYYPPQLAGRMKLTTIATHAVEAHDGGNCSGIIYLPNEHISDNGIKLLSMAENVRHESRTSLNTLDDLAGGTRDWSLTPARHNNRRSSQWSISDDEASTVLTTSLVSFRRKLQRHLLENGQSFEIWRISLKLIALSRVILMVPKEPAPGYLGRKMHSATAWICSSQIISEETEADFAKAAAGEKAWEFRSRLGVSSLERLDKAYSEAGTLGSLPSFLWKRIFEVALASQDKLGVAQFDRMVEWGRERETLGWELEIGGKGRAVRVLSILERTHGVNYDFFL